MRIDVSFAGRRARIIPDGDVEKEFEAADSASVECDGSVEVRLLDMGGADAPAAPAESNAA